MRPGAHYQSEGRCEFVVWAPWAQQVEVRLVDQGQRVVALEGRPRGYWQGMAEAVEAGARYVVRVDGRERPDPASGYQPEGVHGPSAVVDHGAFEWHDGSWRAPPMGEMVMYELHVGTFTPAGTFEAVGERLEELVELGVNAIELMPVGQFPGGRNWGYDGVQPGAVQDTYGGPAGLKRLVDAAHGCGVAIVLDVVYNHLGPEGNYLGDFGPYFTEEHRGPWGQAINFDGAYSDEVRRYFIENALQWLRDYHIDGLRLDALHAIYDMSARPFLQALAEAVEQLGREQGHRYYLIGETVLNDARLIRPRAQSGVGLDGQWNDDFHHALHTLLTAERRGYYADYGKVEHLAKALRVGYVYTGEYSEYGQRSRGNDSSERPAEQFVVFVQNHDQVGNRLMGERLGRLVDFEACKLAAGVMLLSPYVPMLFMGEEYGAKEPFLYFVSHGDAALAEAVREGRQREFASFGWGQTGPDPQSVSTFERSRLRWEQRRQGRHGVLWAWYGALIRARKELAALARPSKQRCEVGLDEDKRLLWFRRWQGGAEAAVLAHVSGSRVAQEWPLVQGAGVWRLYLDSASPAWGGAGSELPACQEGPGQVSLGPWQLAVYMREGQL